MYVGVLEPTVELLLIVLRFSYHIEINVMIVVHPVVCVGDLLVIDVGLIGEPAVFRRLRHHPLEDQFSGELGHRGGGCHLIQVRRRSHLVEDIRCRDGNCDTYHLYFGNGYDREPGAQAAQYCCPYVLLGIFSLCVVIHVLDPGIYGRLLHESNQGPIILCAASDQVIHVIVRAQLGVRILFQDRLEALIGVSSDGIAQNGQRDVVGSNGPRQQHDVRGMIARDERGLLLPPGILISASTISGVRRHILDIDQGVSQEDRKTALGLRGEG